jgi:hypothetical protein
MNQKKKKKKKKKKHRTKKNTKQKGIQTGKINLNTIIQ